MFNFSLSDSKVTCPDCRREYEKSPKGRAWECPSCHTVFEVDGQGQLRRIPSVVAANSSELNGVLRQLDNLEIVLWRMIGGIGHFLTSTMWSWMRKQLIMFGQLLVKAVRVAVVFACWAIISFGPLWLVVRLEATGLFPLLALAWTGLALGGSLWGARYIRHRVQPRIPGLLCRMLHWRKRKPPKTENPPVEANTSDWFPFDKPQPQKGTVVVNNHV